MTANLDDETYSEEETVARREAAIQRLLKMPPKHHRDSKLGKASGNKNK